MKKTVRLELQPPLVEGLTNKEVIQEASKVDWSPLGEPAECRLGLSRIAIDGNPAKRCAGCRLARFPSGGQHPSKDVIRLAVLLVLRRSPGVPVSRVGRWKADQNLVSG